MLSMTGFGRSLVSENSKDVSVEIKSCNHRFLDLSLRLPKKLSFLEEDIRQIISKSLKRGHIDFTVSFTAKEGAKNIAIDKSLIKSYVHEINQVADENGLEHIKSIAEILNLPEIFVLEDAKDDEEELREIVTRAAKEALFRLIDMRKREGLNIELDLHKRLKDIETKAHKIEELNNQAPQTLLSKLKCRLNELMNENIDETRLYQELALLSDKSDISEEITRLKSHISQLYAAFESESENGRRMDFLVQEVNREVNTMASKAQDKDIVNLTVDIKCDIEKMREQIQNVE